MCNTTLPKDKDPDMKLNHNAVHRRDDTAANLNSSVIFKDVELGKSSSQGSTDSSISQSSSIRDRLSAQAATNGKVISAVTLYGFCSISMVLVNKSLASR